MSPTSAQRWFGWLVDEPPDGGDRDPPTAAALPANAARQVGALLLTKAGDRIVDPKTVLAWLLTAVGAPSPMLGLLVPIRESGSMLPQAALVPLVTQVGHRSRVWVAGALGQAVAVVAMAITAATTRGAAAGLLVLAALVVFALARSLCSIASKDVVGRTIPPGRRGRITGWSDSGSGVVAIAVGAGMAAVGAAGADLGASAFTWLLLGAAGAWVVAAWIYGGIIEPDPAVGPEHGAGSGGPAGRAGSRAGDGGSAGEGLGAVALLRDDAPFRRFVAARTLLLVSALTPPYVVAIATRQGGSAIGALGPFVVASGLASLIGGRVWGGYADRSSRLVMVTACGAASAVVLVYVSLLQVEGVAERAWVHPATYFVLALIHTGARVGRATYVVDLGGGDRRTAYVAVSNTVMGVLLLVVGALTAAISTAGPVPALLALAAVGALGVPVGRSLPEV